MVHQNLGICYTRFTPMCYHAIQRINQGSFWSQKISRLQHFPSKWCLNPCMLTRKSLTQHYQMLFSSPSDSNAPSDDSDGHNGGSPRHKDITPPANPPKSWSESFLGQLVLFPIDLRSSRIIETSPPNRKKKKFHVGLAPSGGARSFTP